MSRQLSAKQKQEYLPILIARDGGFNCIYCKGPLNIDTLIFEHLNNNRNDSRIENIALAHQSCNIKKASSYDYQIIAAEKLKENESKMFVGEKIYMPTEAKEASTEIDINVTNFEITEQFLRERITTDGSMEFTDALNSIAYLCKKKTGHGSQQSVRNYISILTSSVGQFMITKNEEKKKIIVRRTGN